MEIAKRTRKILKATVVCPQADDSLLQESEEGGEVIAKDQ